MHSANAPLVPRRARRSPALAALLLASCAGVLAACTVSTAAAADAELPPVADHGKMERHPGKLVWADLVTADRAAAERFYGGLLGWTFRPLTVGHSRYDVAELDGVPVAGLIEPRSTRTRLQPRWIAFLSVADVAQAQRAAREHGGRVLGGPHRYARRGEQVLLADPQGASFVALQASGGDPQDTDTAVGDWIWCSLITSDPQAAASFYRAVFGYESYDAPGDDGSQHLLLATDDYARASINLAHRASGRLHPHWLAFVRVADVRAASMKAETLGARVLVQPHPDRHGGEIAVIADPTGAPLGLMTEPSPESAEAKP